MVTAIRSESYELLIDRESVNSMTRVSFLGRLTVQVGKYQRLIVQESGSCPFSSQTEARLRFAGLVLAGRPATARFVVRRFIAVRNECPIDGAATNAATPFGGGRGPRPTTGAMNKDGSGAL